MSLLFSRQLGCLAPLALAAVLAQPEPLFLDGFFPVGVFSQPVESFPKWKQRGINSLLEVPMNHDGAAWDRAAQAGGFRIIRRPLASGREDIGRKDLLAWSHWDEPDAAGRAPQWTPAIERTARDWRALDPRRRIFINFAGPDVSWFTTQNDSYSRTYSAFYPPLIASADWVASDIYPSAGWLNAGHQGRRGDPTLITEPMKALKRLTTKPQFVFIEASEIERGNVPGARCPTPEEMRAQIGLALIHGARGIFYFPAFVGKGGFRFDAAPPEIVAEMVRQNALLKEAGPILQSPINPTRLSASVPSPLQAGWRAHGDSALFILVNPSRRPVPRAEIQLQGTGAGGQARILGSSRTLGIKDGRAVEDFEPLGVRLLLVKLKA